MHFGDGMCRLLIQKKFNLFAQLKKMTKSHENSVFQDPFSNMAISPQNDVFYTGKLYGLTGMWMVKLNVKFLEICHNVCNYTLYGGTLCLSQVTHGQ